MRRVVPFKKVTTFLDGEKDLLRQLPTFEANVDEAFAGLGSTFPLRLKATTVRTTDCIAMPWDMLRINPANGDMTVRLPPPSIQLAGAWLVIVRLDSSNVVTVLPTIGEVSGTTSITLGTTTKAYPYFCDGVGWWNH